MIKDKHIYLLEYPNFYDVLVVDSDNFTIIETYMENIWKDALSIYNDIKSKYIESEYKK